MTQFHGLFRPLSGCVARGCSPGETIVDRPPRVPCRFVAFVRMPGRLIQECRPSALLPALEPGSYM